ncbi:MAG: FkbM family methyltransferase [Akkermansiaceae bacterium]|nr:FkbM family methyltransferase [Akkermansiaceae bacterium]
MSMTETGKYPPPSPLVSYSQWGDDLLVWEYFGKNRGGTFLEAGANDPKVLSQTYLLEQQGWTGVLVEPVPECCTRLRAERPGSRVFQNALGAPQQRGVLRLAIPNGLSELTSGLAEGAEPAEGARVIEAGFITLSEALDQAGIERLDYLSLDLEGMELEALKGLDFKRHPPRLIIIEDRLGDLLRHRFLGKNGYKLVRRNGSNDWYVPMAEPFAVPLAMRIELLRKVYLSMPFRWFRGLSRQLRGKQK